MITFKTVKDHWLCGLALAACLGTLVRTKMYMYLHKKHAALVPRVAQALVKLKKDGTYQRIYNSTLKPMTN